MKKHTGLLRLLLGAMLAALVVFLLVTPSTPVEASPSVSVALVDAEGNAVAGAIPPRVLLDLTDSIPASSEWHLLKSIYGTEFSKRLVGASGYVDAGFSDTTGTVFTLDVPSYNICGGNTAFETEDVLIKIGSLLTFGAPDAGASTTVLDVGISGAVEKYAKDVNMLAAANTRVLGSQTIVYGPNFTTDAGFVVTSVRNVDAATTAYRLTVTQSAKNLTTATGGRIDVYVKCGRIPERQ